MQEDLDAGFGQGLVEHGLHRFGIEGQHLERERRAGRLAHHVAVEAFGAAGRLDALRQLEGDAADDARVAVEERHPLGDEVGRGRPAEAAAALEQQGAGAAARRRERRDGARSAAADDDDVVRARDGRGEGLLDGGQISHAKLHSHPGRALLV